MHTQYKKNESHQLFFLLFENQLQPPTPTLEPIHCTKEDSNRYIYP